MLSADVARGGANDHFRNNSGFHLMLKFARYAGAIAVGCLALSAHAQVADEAATPASGDAGAEERRLDVFNYAVTGNTVLSRAEIEAAVTPYLGPQRTVADIEAARFALMKAYHSKGYETVDVRIPQQDPTRGNIRFEVVELTVGRLRVEGARHFSPEDIKARVPSLAEGGVPNYREVSTQIAAVNKSSDRLVTPTLQAGSTPGTVDVTLNIEDQLPVHGSLELNDRASNRTRRLRLAAGVSYNNLFQLGHSINLQAQATPEDLGESLVVSASYVAPIEDTPFTVVAYGVHSDSDVAAVGGIDVLGAGDIFGLRGIFTKITGDRDRTIVHQVTAGADYKSFTEDLVVGADRAQTPIDYIPLTLQYSLAQRAKRHDLQLGVGVNLGLRGLDATDREFESKRFGARANWAVLTGNASYTHKFESDWRASARMALQYAGKPTISNEQFSAGGIESTRGYYESQEVGDDGISLQLQLDTPSMHKLAGDWLNEGRLFLFADGADFRTYRPLSGQDKYAALGSVGFGATARALGVVNASVVFAMPLVERASTLTDIEDHTRIHARLWAEF